MINSEFYVSDTVNPSSIISFLKASKSVGNEIYRLEIYHRGNVKVRLAIPPYSCEDKQQLYSLSKTFTSSAIGMLVDDGVITVEDKMTDIFPDKMPENISQSLAAMRIKHLLSMNTGHESCVMGKIKNSTDPVREFFAQEVKYAPGTHFAYNSAASYILSAIVGKYTGVSMFDFLSERLFTPLEIEGVWWDTYPDGNSQGGIGLHASIDDITKLGILYLNKGVYEGKRILSEKWIEEATSYVSDNSGNGNPDWCSGYGYQIWHNSRLGYRGDGARGQLCVVLNDKDIVVCVHAVVSDMQKEIDDVFEMIDTLFTPSKNTLDELRTMLCGYYDAPSYGTLGSEYLGKMFTCELNKQGVTRVMFEMDENKTVTVKFSNGSMWQSIKSGYGDYEKSVVYLKELKPMLTGLADADRTERLCMASYYTVKDGVLRLHIRYTNTPQDDMIEFVIDNGKVKIVPCDMDFRVKA